ncbi:hypothetical protein PR001_g15507 [Phytophthora rubi]|uniref:Uncharacterized protein n=1 Tax=Phytophthora rubi TaxID=129364 RepID=A0A6A3L542_9STRA|nr:hypothetical protein PR001_g15507 [Phytophthora rubi]
MTDKVEINKNGRPVGWRGQSWVYYKSMMMIAFEEKDVVDFVTGKKTVVDTKDQEEFDAIQAKIKLIIMGSLSMELGQLVMMKKTGTEMWEYLEDYYEGKTNAATRVNQEIILFNRLQTPKCKAGEDVDQHVDNMFTIKAQLAALNADVRGPIFIQMLVQSLPTNDRFNRLKGMMESGSKKMNSPEKVKDQILRMESYNKCDKMLREGEGDGKLKYTGVQDARSVKNTDLQEGRCFGCHLAEHRRAQCPEESKTDNTDAKDTEVTEDLV